MCREDREDRASAGAAEQHTGAQAAQRVLGERALDWQQASASSALSTAVGAAGTAHLAFASSCSCCFCCLVRLAAAEEPYNNCITLSV